MIAAIERYVDTNSDEQNARLAAEVLSNVRDPNQLNLQTFFNVLRHENETLYGELLTRATEQPEM